MTRRHQLPARLPAGTIDRFDLDAIVDRTTDGTWAEKALAEQAAGVRSIALAVADGAVYVVAKVFQRHNLVDDVLDVRDINALHEIITQIAARLVHEQLIDRLGEGRCNSAVGEEIAVSAVPRELRR